MATEREEKSAREEELDRFWNIDALLPRRRSFPRSEKTEAIEVEVPAISQEKKEQATSGEVIPKRGEGATVVHSVAPVGGEPIRNYVNPDAVREIAKTPKPDDEYVPQCALIHNVKIYRWKSSYQYYEDFVKTAEKLQSVRGVPCQAVKFFSYVPQYSQMTRAQFGWYLWFRECVRRGEFPETDYSYILLYAYEIINLSDRIAPSVGQAQLFGLWLHYRETYRQLDSYLPDWICDYSLIHHLPPPDPDAKARAALMQRCVLKEFYVGGESEDGYLQALMVFCCNYDYRRSKFCTEENRPLFDRSMKTVLQTVTQKLSEDGKLFSASGMEDSRLTRDAYSGALCSYRMKRKLEVSYCSFSRSHELRFLITDILKYTENRIRGYLGVRSKLTIYALPIVIRELIDRCMDETLPRRITAEQRREQQEEAAYAAFYDVPKAPLSVSHAAEIEQTSWNTTQKLVDAFEEEIIEIEAAPEVLEPKQPSKTDGTEETHFLYPYRAFLEAALREDAAGQRKAAAVLGKLTDAVAEEINEWAADAMGDVLLEDGDVGYRVIDDYRDWLCEAMQAAFGKES